MFAKVTDMLIGPALPPPPEAGRDPAVEGPASGNDRQSLRDYAGPAAVALVLGGGALLLVNAARR